MEEKLNKAWVNENTFIQGYIQYYNHHLQQFRDYKGVPVDMSIDIVNIDEFKKINIRNLDDVINLRDALNDYIDEFEKRKM